MNTPNDGGPAFPYDDSTAALHAGCQPMSYPGMSLRDWFAGIAMGPLMASDGFERACMCDPEFKLERDLPAFCAQEAYRIADAMLAERKKTTP